MVDYMTYIVKPYVESVQEKLNCHNVQPLVTMDAWSVHTSKKFREFLYETEPFCNYYYVYIPGGCTSVL